MNTPVALVGRSPAIQRVEQEVDAAARSSAKVLITGESGAGKEIVARLIHRRSRRSHAPLVTINCAGLPDSLLESELFGHVRGSFTGAHRDKAGYLQRAHGGTIFMDEVGEMSLRMQALLLRFLETGEVQRIGSDERVPPLDVRVITATHRPLLDLVAKKAFRDDLYYRLHVVHIEVPPLRERPEDIPILVQQFLEQAAALHRLPVPDITPAALACLGSYTWPGNVRELKNIIERTVVRCCGERIDPRMLPEDVRQGGLRFDATSSPRAAASATLDGNGIDAVESGIAEELFRRMTIDRQPFWTAVYEPFMARDLTRTDVRDVVRLGLRQTRGNYKLLVEAFNMPADDYKRFLNFLRKYGCHVPFQMFRTVPAGEHAAMAAIA